MSDPSQKYWEKEYKGERYIGDPPIPFVDEITDIVKERLPDEAEGMYIGCGNGRNFIPLVENGLNLIGIDYSGTAIKQIIARRPDLRRNLRTENFIDMEGDNEFDYILALQVFQHGLATTARENFARAHRLLRPGGLFFLRVNSVDTQITTEHHLEGPAEDKDFGGFSARYREGRIGKLVHFFTREELEDIAQKTGFEIIVPLREVEIPRNDEENTHWTQWESVWKAA